MLELKLTVSNYADALKEAQKLGVDTLAAAEAKKALSEFFKPYAGKWVMMEIQKTKCMYLAQIYPSGLEERHVWGYSDMGIFPSDRSMLFDKSGELTLYIAEDEAEVRNRSDLWSKMMDVYKTGEAINFGRK